MSAAGVIPRQPPLSWGIVFRVSLAGMRRRLMRSLVTVGCVVLALAFLTYMLVLADVTQGFVDLNDAKLNLLLQQKGVNIYAQSQTDAMTILLISLALLTCTVGIANSMLMSVAERVREIGTLKCLGARDGFIVQSYLVESSLQGLCGSVVGIILGCLVAVVVSAATYPGYLARAFPAPAVLGSVAVAMLIGLVISIVTSIWPARVAAHKRPVDALRVEE
jgi:ABC-type antimicrobial peptide transport system permease subunit